MKAAVGRALREQAAQGLEDEVLLEARRSLKAARKTEEATFAQHVRRAADEAAASAAHAEMSRLQHLVAASVSVAVREETERTVSKVVRDDPKLKRLLAEQLRNVKVDVRQAAEKELSELCDEDRHHRVNGAFLAALQKRADRMLEDAERKATESVEAAKRAAYIAQLISAVALLAAVGAVFLNQGRAQL